MSRSEAGRKLGGLIFVGAVIAMVLSSGGALAIHFVWVDNPNPTTVDAHWHNHDTHPDLKALGYLAYFYRWCWNRVGGPVNCDNMADVYAVYYPIPSGQQCTWVQPEFYVYTITGLTLFTTYDFRLFVFWARFTQDFSCSAPKLVLPPDIRGGDTNYCLSQANCRVTTPDGPGDPPPRGGSPHVTLYNPSGDWTKETNVLPQSESHDGPNPPDWEDAMLFSGTANASGDLYRVEIHEFQSASNFLDRVSLTVVDHASGDSVAVAPDGQVHTYRSTVAPITAVNAIGSNVRPNVLSKDGVFYQATPNDWVTVDFGPLSSLPGPKQKLVISSRDNIPLGSCCFKMGIPVQVEASDGSWGAMTTVYPRLHNRVQIVDLTGLFVPNGNARVRVLLVDEHEIDWLAIEAGANGAFTQTTVSPSQVNYSSGAFANRQLILSDDGSYMTLNPGEYIFVTFPVPSPVPGQRSLILRVNGYYVGGGGGSGPIGGNNGG
jgi:hypothetical protein